MNQTEHDELKQKLAEKEAHLENVRKNYSILNRGISGVGDADSDFAWKSEEKTLEKEIEELKEELAETSE